MARPKLGESETKRLQLVITEDELAAIDDWRFAKRVGSRSEAVRKLVQLGIIADAAVSDIARPVYDAAEALVVEHRDEFRNYQGIVLATISAIEAHDRMDVLAKRMNAIHEASDIRESIQTSASLAAELDVHIDEWREQTAEIRERKPETK